MDDAFDARSPPDAAPPAHWQLPCDATLRPFLALPQLALVAESCAAERALHAALMGRPTAAVSDDALAAMADADARDNYAVFLAFRDALVAAGTLEAWYLAAMRSGRVAVPPLFVDLVVEAIVGPLLDDAGANAFSRRAGELLHRAQRVAVEAGQVVVGDLETLDRLNNDGGFGDLGRLLREAQAPLRGSRLRVLTADNAADYDRGGTRGFLLDMTHEVRSDVGHGLSFTMNRAHSGLRALAGVLERWTLHFLGVRTTIEPLRRIDDGAWAWHIGLDVEATALLNDLWHGEALAPSRSERLLGLFRLDFVDPAEMRADLAGKPVYLGLAMTEARTLKLKPQNLLLDLPLAAAM